MKHFNTLIYTVFVLGLVACGNNAEKSNEHNDSAAVQHTNNQKQQPIVADGPYKETYPDGKIRIEGEMKNGTRFGLWKAFYPSGGQQSEDYFEDGKKNGKTATYYKNGRIRYVGYFSWDKPSGKWDFYDSTGTLVSSKEY